jgi:NAD(P)-dependent dehydrogenase (short-subunit alcohol dehydrogenase family)
MLRSRKRRNFHWGAVDGRDHEALRAFVKEAGERLGRIDVLVNNAGIAMEGILPTMRMRDIVEAIEVNLTAALVLAQACSRFMLRQGAGCIVNVSLGARYPRPCGRGRLQRDQSGARWFDAQPCARARTTSDQGQFGRSRLFRQRHGQQDPEARRSASLGARRLVVSRA